MVCLPFEREFGLFVCFFPSLTFDIELHVVFPSDDTGMFWGIQYYNDMLLVSGSSGNVQSEILLRKDPGHFTFREGWAFPRRISFNADECVMPLPDDYPRLPNSRGHSSTLTPPLIFFLSLFSFAFLYF